MKLAELITPAALQSYVRNQIPSGKTLDQIDTHIHSIVHRLEEGLRVEADFDSYGSGWASFVDIFCSRIDGSSNRKGPDDSIITEGIRIYVSRLAPLAVFGISEVWRRSGGHGSNFLELPELNVVPPEWQVEWSRVNATLEDHGILILPAEDAKQQLPFATELDTNLGEPPFRVFDAVFHWSD